MKFNQQFSLLTSSQKLKWSYFTNIGYNYPMNKMLFLQHIQYSCVEVELHYKYSSCANEVSSLFLHEARPSNNADKRCIKKSHICKTYGTFKYPKEFTKKRLSYPSENDLNQNFRCLSSVFFHHNRH